MHKKLLIASLSSSMVLSSLISAPQVFAGYYDSQIEEVKEEAEQSESQIYNLEETLAHLEEINFLEQNIDKRTEQLEEKARKIQIDGQPVNYLEFIIEAEFLSDVVGRIDVVISLVRSNRDMVTEQARDMEAVVEKTEETERTIVQQNSLAAELETMSEDLEQQQLEQEVLVAQLAAERATAEEDRAYYLEQREAAQEQVVQLVNDREEAREAVRQAQEQQQEEEAEE